MRKYLVGGAVRDKLIGATNQDVDWLITGVTYQDMLDAGFKPIHAAEFPIFIKNGEEYALARKERKSGKGYKGFDLITSPTVTLEEDLSRRDLSINSIAMDENGDLIDPFNGVSDIENRLLRHTSSAFNEDPVRILRVARFMAQLGEYGFRVAEDTLQLMTDMVTAGEVNHLTPERIWKETENALKSSHPELFFRTLNTCGALEIIMPELHALIDIPQPIAHHPENCVFEHIMLALKQSVLLSNNNPMVNFSVLMHDLGKAVSPKDMLPSHHDHEEAGLPLVTTFCDRLKVPNHYRDLAMKVTQHHLRAHKIMTMRPGSVVDLLDKLGTLKKGESTLALFLCACEADAKGRLGLETRDYPQADYLRAIHQAVIATDTSMIVERYKGQGAAISGHIRQARIREACKAKIELLARQAEAGLNQ